MYHRQTQPLVDFYSGRPTFRTIDGNQPPDAVTASMDAAICAGVGRDAGGEATAVIVCKSPAELEKMRGRQPAGRADARRRCAAMVAPGVTTADLDADGRAPGPRRRAPSRRSRAIAAIPATLCASVNEEVVHGIPSAAPLREGDIVSLDMGVKLDGFYGDSARDGAGGRGRRRTRQRCCR